MGGHIGPCESKPRSETKLLNACPGSTFMLSNLLAIFSVDYGAEYLLDFESFEVEFRMLLQRTTLKYFHFDLSRPAAGESSTLCGLADLSLSITRVVCPQMGFLGLNHEASNILLYPQWNPPTH